MVTTQTIEAGAELDFEAIAFESCPIDALIQRRGRLDGWAQLERAAVCC